MSLGASWQRREVDGQSQLFLLGDWRVAYLDGLLKGFDWSRESQGCTVIALNELEAGDSATLALLMEWTQVQTSRGMTLQIRGMAQPLRELVALYRLQDMLHIGP
ncbi:STAS domain-containing protein [Acidithiobacillus sp.]|uniref:STAS domain-containing protein n=1 Tax=Acidithiobacillus sp. TaxID=1872118 RepID=UPI002607136E|nr:STAS domain-containing protein [Acidithiobacillus sp.]MDD2748920.1 STAS domain-containing protein [Acidithiobacillus sp.]MDD5278390.1 STAS domain-containing protein [Acidithiobacillus sp.]